MNKQREEICRECSMKPSIHDLECPVCQQPRYPLDEEEWKELGYSRSDVITVDGVRRMMEISVRPYCMDKMLAAHPIEWWHRMITRSK